MPFLEMNKSTQIIQFFFSKVHFNPNQQMMHKNDSKGLKRQRPTQKMVKNAKKSKELKGFAI